VALEAVIALFLGSQLIDGDDSSKWVVVIQQGNMDNIFLFPLIYIVLWTPGMWKPWRSNHPGDLQSWRCTMFDQSCQQLYL
jgi:hypothetical protein